MSITLVQDAAVDAAKYHLYIRSAESVPADYKKATIDAILAAASHFKKVETGFELVTAKGDTVKITTGSEIVISGDTSGTIKALGLTSVDYKALMDQATGYQGKDVDIFVLKAPTSQVSGTCTVGQLIFSVYAVNVYQALEIKDGVPHALNITWNRTDEASEMGTEMDTIATD